MKIYLIMQSNACGNNVVNSTWATKAEAEAECNRLRTSQERYDNHYYCVGYDLQGNIGEALGNKYLKKLGELAERGNCFYEKLKNVSKAIGQGCIEQPEKCLFDYGGSCCYPIEKCFECPCHPWNDEYMPLTSCKIN